MQARAEIDHGMQFIEALRGAARGHEVVDRGDGRLRGGREMLEGGGHVG